MIKNMNKAMITIKTTMKNHQHDDTVFPYFFIVGAGISTPEIPTSNSIIKECKDRVKSISQDYYNDCEKETEDHIDNPMKYYSSWIQFAFPNRIDRSNFFKQLIQKSKISSANLMLAQILNSKSFANTVFTTNFDDSLKKALELMGTDNVFVAENAMDNLAVNNQTKDIQIVHVHGTYNFYDCANLETEINNIATQSGIVSPYRLLSSFLSNQAPIIVGYSGWENDVIMTCLKERLIHPTPLQFIWVCYDRNSYENLPDWLKNSDSVYFVLPDEDIANCIDENNSVSFIKENKRDERNDATTFFRRIKAEFNIPSPTIFSDPYSYYSERFDKLLPEHDDVLHLRYWIKRMKVLNSNDSEFEKHLKALEQKLIKKDYIAAGQELATLKDIDLPGTDVEFLCSSLIKDFILAENVIPFDQRITFHHTVIEFIESHLNSFSDYDLLNDSLILTISIKISDYDEGQKLIPLFDHVYAIAANNKKLFEVELHALSRKAALSDRETEAECWKSIIEKTSKATKDINIQKIRVLALVYYCLLVEPDESEKMIKESDRILKSIDSEFGRIIVSKSKAKLLFKIHNKRTQRKWAKDIIQLYSEEKQNKFTHYYIDIIYSLLNHETEMLSTLFDISKLINDIIQILENYKPDIYNQKALINYLQCCEFVYKNSDDSSMVVKYCKTILDLKELIQTKDDIYSFYLRFALIYYLQLPDSIVTDTEKNKQLLSLKNNTIYESVFYEVLEEYWYYKRDSIDSLPVLKENKNIVEKDSSLLDEGYNCYCNGEKSRAEKCFTAIIDSKCKNIAKNAVGNLMFMVRRGEVENEGLSFWTLVDQLDSLTSTSLMNTLLYCIEHNEQNRKEFIEAKNVFYKLSEEELENVVDWWNKEEIVGEEESKLALAIVNGSLKD